MAIPNVLTAVAEMLSAVPPDGMSTDRMVNSLLPERSRLTEEELRSGWTTYNLFQQLINGLKHLKEASQRN